jgi:iron complex outermembrane receptor protein
MNATRHLSIVLLLAAPAAFAEEDIEAIYGTQEEGSEDIISLASGYSQPLVHAPAIANVVTANDIQKLGATTLAEVLATVPGLHVSTARGVNDIFVIRGFYDEFNASVLLLLNGIPVNNVVNGGRPQAWRMPVHDIARIEIIRGPGSALYGADAVAGVVNVITKTAEQIDGTEVGAYAGSFATYGGWLQSSGRWGDIEAALSLEASTTEGYRKIIEADDQTRIDRLLGTHASRAPGPLNTQRDDVDARLDLKGERWRFRAGYQGFLNVGTGVGITLALDPDGDFSVGLTNADFTYDLLRSGPWDVAAQFSYLGTTTEASLNPFPPGAFGGLFEDGIRDDFHFRVDEVRGGVTALYGGIPEHRFRFGAGFSNARLSDITESRNFRIGPGGAPIPTPFADVREFGEPPLLSEQDRTDLYGFAQDEWRFAPDWILTAGVRLDDYSDFGATVNPRLALVWNPSPSLTAKALYGRAFRAPSFTELYGNNIVAIAGNPDLEPEIINMVQFALAKQWSPRVRTSVNLYGYDLDHQIRGGTERGTPGNPLTKIQQQNREGRRGYGVELEAEYQVAEDLSVRANYAYYTPQNALPDDVSRLAPEHQIYTALDWRIAQDWSLNARLKWVSDREWESMGEAAKIEDYTWAGATLRRSDPQGWFFSLTLDNLFDADGAEPALFSAIPYGIPLPGRRVMAQFGWHFQ